MSPPISVRQHDHSAALVGHFLLGKKAPPGRRDAKRGEEIRRDAFDLHAFRRTSLADNRRAPADGGRLLKGNDGFAPIIVVGQRRTGARHAGLRVSIDRGDEPVGFTERKRSQEHRIDDGENDEVGAKTEREREHRHGSETRSLGQFATRIFEAVHGGNPNSKP